MKIRCLIAIVVLGLLCSAAQSQESKAFPTDDEIRLVVTQTDRALVDYIATAKQEQHLLESTTDAENDKRVIDGLTAMSKGFEAKPQAFNSRFGLEFVLLLDDASRNAALCNADAITKGIKATVAGETQAAQDYLQLAQSCTSVSNLLYTISENAAALYQRYVNGEEDLAQQAFDEMNKCRGILKQQKPK